jgi:hypothetical protein
LSLNFWVSEPWPRLSSSGDAEVDRHFLSTQLLLERSAELFPILRMVFIMALSPAGSCQRVQ